MSTEIEECMFSRLSTPFLLREFLIWIEDYKEGDAEFSRGLLWGGLLIASPCAYMPAHHQKFWCVFERRLNISKERGAYAGLALSRVIE